MRPITDLRDCHVDEDIFVIGSGASMDHYDPRFFLGRTVLAINETWKRFPCTYVIHNDKYDIKPPVPDIGPRFEHGQRDRDELEVDYVYDHLHNRVAIDDEALSVLGTDMIVVGTSTQISAIHVAAYMGARSVILCGCDGCALDGKMNYRGAYPDDSLDSYHAEFLSRVAVEIRLLRDAILETYGCHVYTMSPFLGLRHEGHRVS